VFKKEVLLNNFLMPTEKSFNSIILKFSKKLKELRLSQNLTQEDMTQHGFNYRHYQRLESGKVAPTLYTLYKISKVFKVQIGEFFD